MTIKIWCPHCRAVAEYNPKDGVIECLSEACRQKRWKFDYPINLTEDEVLLKSGTTNHITY